MRKLIFIFPLLFVFYISCSKTSFCEGKGKIVKQNYFPGGFHKIEIHYNIELEIVHAGYKKMEIQTYENLLSYFHFEVKDSTLILSFEKNCMYRNDKNIMHVKIWTDTLTEIRNSSEYSIFSRDTLKFDRLKLISENYNDPSSPAVGSFDLIVRSKRLDIVSNNLSVFKLTGNVQILHVGFYAGLSRLEAKNLKAGQIFFIQRSANDMEIFPENLLSGDIYSTGNVLIFNEPDSLHVREHFTGKLVHNY